MPAELARTTVDGCRLCGFALRSFEFERKLCTVCEEYAHQLGVSDEEFEKVVSELLSEPMFQPPRLPIV